MLSIMQKVIRFVIAVMLFVVIIFAAAFAVREGKRFIDGPVTLFLSPQTQ